MTLRTGITAIGFILTLILADQASAGMVSIGSEKDANMIQTNPTNTAGGNVFIGTGRNQNRATRRGLIQFDVSSIPTGSTINSVTLTLYLRAWSGSGTGGLFGDPRNVFLHQVTSAWGNGTTVAPGGGGQGTASAMDGDVSWNNRSFSTTPPIPPTVDMDQPRWRLCWRQQRIVNHHQHHCHERSSLLDRSRAGGGCSSVG